jgi:crotonobetainyl-CoA:carnitine CoA-transferase CaiB-like acyl-CoA transferase
MTRSGPQVWLSITGHGRDRPLRIAFGDDAAAAGGAVVHDRGGPCFCADALADPVTGLIATRAVLGALERGGRWLLDASMASCAAAVAGPTETGTGAVPVPPPIPRVTSTARPFGADTASVVADLVC